MARGILADRAHDFEHPEPPGVSIADGCEDQGPKKTANTDEIFENVWELNALADADAETLRISVDTKATVNVGEYSRGGRSRGLQPVQAWDHDMRPKEKVVPGGILEPVSGRAFLFLGCSHKTSDFLVDGLVRWWEARKQALSGLKRLFINMDNGPECSGRRTQFLLRMVEFVDMSGLEVRLIYYPPYHSKYNPIERYWAGLEKSWNGYLLDSVEVLLNRAANFYWRGVRTTVTLLDAVYEKGVSVRGKEKQELERRLKRSQALPWWDITIHPKTVQQ